MRAAVCCPGPSLESVADRVAADVGYDLRVGVNRAVNRIRCDYWCALDKRSWEIARPIGTPVLICDRGNYVQLAAAFPGVKRHHNLGVEDIARLLPHKQVKWHSWSGTAAIVAAYFVMHTDPLRGREGHEIDVWGADWSGQNDFDGYHDAVQNRGDERWGREKKLFVAIQQWLATMGATVRRIPPAISGLQDRGPTP